MRKDIRCYLHSFKLKIKLKLIEKKEEYHRKKTKIPESLSILPVNKLPNSLRDEEICVSSKNIRFLQETIYEETNTPCNCKCHLSSSQDVKTFFHTTSCVDNCQMSNNNYVNFLTTMISPMYEV